MRRRLVSFLSLLCTGLAVVGGVHPGQAMAAEVEPFAQVGRVVAGILGYARWPKTPETYRFCVAGAAAYLPGDASSLTKATGYPVSLRALGSDDVPGFSSCDVLYLGSLPAAQRSALLATTGERPLLTIIESDPLCAGSGMFCLNVRGSEVGLLVNIDAISRSSVRINPKVLQLVRRREGM